MANVEGTSEYGQLSDKPSEGNFREQFPNTTSTGKKETSNTKSPKITKVLSYPLARRNEAPTDYLQIEIAEYDPAGLKLPAFTDGNDKKPSDKGFDINTIKSPEGTFALSRGSQTNIFQAKEKINKSKILSIFPFLETLQIHREFNMVKVHLTL